MTANSVLFRVLLGLVLCAPLPLGGNRLWAWSSLAVGVGAVAVVWAALVLVGRARASMSNRMLWLSASSFMLVLIWATLQASSIPPSSLWHPMWTEAALALGDGAVKGMVTADPTLTREAIVRLACYATIFWLAVQLGRERARAHEACLAICVATVIYAIYGLTIHYARLNVILWMPKWAYVGDLTSTFVNRNAYGAYAGLGVICCIGMFIHTLRPSRGGHDRRAAELAHTVLSRALPYLLGALINGAALLLSHSRGAFLATAVAMLALLAQLAFAGVMRARMIIPLVVVVLTVGIATIGLTGERTLSRLVAETNTAHEADRVNVYRLTIEAITDAALTGTGLGAFQPAFRVYQDTSLPWIAIWDYAHNVYLELAMDIGIPMTGVFGLGLLVLLGCCLRGLLYRRRDHVYPALALSAVVLLGVHGTIDFSPQTPAIAATLALLLGMGFAQSWNTIDHDASRGPATKSKPANLSDDADATTRNVTVVGG